MTMPTFYCVKVQESDILFSIITVSHWQNKAISNFLQRKKYKQTVHTNIAKILAMSAENVQHIIIPIAYVSIIIADFHNEIDALIAIELADRLRSKGRFVYSILAVPEHKDKQNIELFDRISMHTSIFSPIKFSCIEDNVLVTQAVRALLDMILLPGYMKLGLSDLRRIMNDGVCNIVYGYSTDSTQILAALNMALKAQFRLGCAYSVLVNFTVKDDLSIGCFDAFNQAITPLLDIDESNGVFYSVVFDTTISYPIEVTIFIMRRLYNEVQHFL